MAHKHASQTGWGPTVSRSGPWRICSGPGPLSRPKEPGHGPGLPYFLLESIKTILDYAARNNGNCPKIAPGEQFCPLQNGAGPCDIDWEPEVISQVESSGDTYSRVFQISLILCFTGILLRMRHKGTIFFMQHQHISVLQVFAHIVINMIFVVSAAYLIGIENKLPKSTLFCVCFFDLQKTV